MIGRLARRFERAPASVEAEDVPVRRPWLLMGLFVAAVLYVTVRLVQMTYWAYQGLAG